MAFEVSLGPGSRRGGWNAVRRVELTDETDAWWLKQRSGELEHCDLSASISSGHSMTAPIRRTAAQTAHARRRIEMEEACRLLGGAVSRAFRASDQDQGCLSGPARYSLSLHYMAWVACFMPGKWGDKESQPDLEMKGPHCRLPLLHNEQRCRKNSVCAV